MLLPVPRLPSLPPTDRVGEALGAYFKAFLTIHQAVDTLHRPEEIPMRLTTLTIACLLIATPALAQDKATIEKLNDAFIAAFSKGDFAAVANLYTEDATVLPNGSSMVKGRSGIQAFWTQAGQEIA